MRGVERSVLVDLRENLAADRVAELERSALVKVEPTTPMRGVIAQMREQRSGCALVCEASGLAGIVTERDVLKRVLRPGADLDAPVRDYMTKDPVTIKADDRVGLAIGQMLRGGYRHLPIVDDAGTPIGAVSVKGIVHYLVSHFPSAVYNLPPAPGQTQTSREGA